MRASISSLADFPLRNPVYRSEGKEFRKLLCGHHLIFYLVIEDTAQTCFGAGAAHGPCPEQCHCRIAFQPINIPASWA
jgi:hypothetical protein